MVSRQIEIDEETDRILTHLLNTRDVSEELLDDFERDHHDELVLQKERSERDFREGNWTTWEEVKRRNGL